VQVAVVAKRGNHLRLASRSPGEGRGRSWGVFAKVNSNNPRRRGGAKSGCAAGQVIR